MVQIKSLAAVLALGASALAQTVHQVSVEYRFDPDTVTAAKGDIIQFNFMAGGGSAVGSSAYDSACNATSESSIYSSETEEVR